MIETYPLYTPIQGNEFTLTKSSFKAPGTQLTEKGSLP